MSTVKALNPLLALFNTLVDLTGTAGTVKVPKDFHGRVKKLQENLEDDVSGLVNSVIDFAVEAALVDYYVETDNKNLTFIYNGWLDSINSNLRGKKVETGIRGLARQYFMERWKNSSLMVLRTIWGERDGFRLPLKMWFVDGKDIYVNGDEETAIIGNERYQLKVSRRKKIELPVGNERLFVQSPYSRWGDDYPTPFLVQRGILHNLMTIREISTKSEKVLKKSLEYLMTFKKGAEALIRENKVSYSEEDLKDLKKRFKNWNQERKSEEGLSAFFSNFDTMVEHLIPEYGRILDQKLHLPFERKILQGLGLVEILEGTTATRRESVLNPKPFIREVKQGIRDFKSLLNDILLTIKEENEHRTKYRTKKIKVRSGVVSDFISEAIRDHFRRMYQHGVLSKKTYTEVCGEEVIDYGLERSRRLQEYMDKDDILMYPPIIQNTEQNVAPEEEERLSQEEETKKKREDRQDYINAKILEQAPYKKTSELPNRVKKNMTKELQKIFMDVVNKALKKYEEERAFKIAWSVIKKIAKKNKSGKWVRKEKANIDSLCIEFILDNFEDL